MAKITKLWVLISWGLSASHELRWKASNLRSTWLRRGITEQKEVYLNGGVGETQPLLPAAARRHWNQVLAPFGRIGSTENIFLIWKILLPVKWNMATGAWLQRCITEGTRWSQHKEHRENSPPSITGPFLWFFKKTQVLLMSPSPFFSVSISFSLLTCSLLIFFM